MFFESEGKHVNGFATIPPNWIKKMGIFIIVTAFTVMDAALIGFIDCMDFSFFSFYSSKE